MSESERRDSLGRRIGYNWWRQYNLDQLFLETEMWLRLRESGEYIRGDVAGADHHTCYYQLTEEEFRSLHPKPTLQDILIQNSGLGNSYRGTI